MCKPSRPATNTAEIVAIAAMVVVVLAVIGIVGPAVVAVAEIVVEVVKFAAIGIASAVMLAALIWLAVQILQAMPGPRPRLRISRPARLMPRRAWPVPVTDQSCLTCGDSGRIVRVIGNRGDLVQLRACPDCQPSQLTR